MKALVKAGSRLQKKFSSDIVATASFANLDTSSSIGRSTVFLRVDVMRSNLLRQLAAAGSSAGDTLSRQVSGALEAAVVLCTGCRLWEYCKGCGRLSIWFRVLLDCIFW
eukprot:gene9307-9472_t